MKSRKINLNISERTRRKAMEEAYIPKRCKIVVENGKVTLRKNIKKGK